MKPNSSIVRHLVTPLWISSSFSSFSSLRPSQLLKRDTPAPRQGRVPRRYVATAIQTGLAVGVCAAATALTALFLNQRRLIWVGQRRNGAMFEASDVSQVPGAELIRLSDDIVGCYFAANQATLSDPGMAPLPTLCYFHGNGDQIGVGGVFLGAMFSKLGFGFLAVEYPGYGMSGVDGDGPGMGEGPTEAGILRAGEALLLHLEKAKGVSRDDMVLVGQSIGCAPALTLASRGFGRRLVLLSPFLSMSRMASEVFPFLGPLLQLAPFFLFDKLDNAAAAKAFPQNVPVLIFHGTKDEVVPFSQGKELAQLFPSGSCTFVPLKGRGHNDIFEPRSIKSITGLITDFASAAHR